MNNAWGSFPRWWVRSRMTTFNAGPDAGTHMSALRIYLALAMKVDFWSRTLAISWSGLQDLTGLSRPVITRGIHALENAGLVRVDRNHHRHAYELLRSPDDPKDEGFSKVPLRALEKALPQITPRGHIALETLKLYIVLLRLAPRDHSFIVPITHRKLLGWTGMQPNRIRAAADVLVNHHLIHINKVEGGAETNHRHNEYHLLGFGHYVAGDEDTSLGFEDLEAIDPETAAA